MAEKNEYFTQKLENGTLQISEDVVASVAAAAVLEVERLFAGQDRAGRRQDERGVDHRSCRRTGQRQHLRHRHAEGTEKISQKANPLLA